MKPIQNYLPLRVGKSIVSTLGLLFLVASALHADDRFFPVTSKGRLSATSLGVPSCNEKGDIVFRVITANQRSISVILGTDQIAAADESAVFVPETVRTSTGTLNSFPTINASGSVLAYNLISPNQIVHRLDRTGPNTYLSQPIARAEVSQTPPSPFSFVSPIGGIADSGLVYFYGERTPVGQPFLKAVYGSKVEVAAPATVTPLASSAGGYSTLDGYVACSGSDSYAVWRGTGPSGLGVYASGGHPGAAAAAGFTNTGSRPSINSPGHLALSATYTPTGGPATDGIFIRQANGVVRRAGNMSNGANVLSPVGIMPASIQANSFDRVSLNEFGQAMFTALDMAGTRTLYTTSLGRCRPLLAVGDQVMLAGTVETVSGVGLFDGLKKNGQGIFWISTDNGNKEFILRSGRGFNQAKLSDTPFTPSYQATKYLLRSIPAQEAAINAAIVASGNTVPVSTRVRAIGCNLTSSANLLTAYGYDVSPGELQNWLVENWSNPPEGRSSSDYISATNDIVEGAVQLYSHQHQLDAPLAPIIQFSGMHNPAAVGAMTNFQKLVEELRQGYPVKLRVPNGGYDTKPYKPFGHYVLAYGIADPGKTGPLTPADILIHDPGNGGIYTLEDYGSQLPKQSPAKYDATHPGWLEDNSGGRRRLHLYRPAASSPPLSLPPTLQLQLALQPAPVLGIRPRDVPGSRAWFLVTDAMGRRLGTGPNGTEYNEIPGGDYFVEEPYTGLDGDEGENDSAWEGFRVRQNLALSGLLPGQYTITITAVDKVQFAMSAGATGSARAVSEHTGSLNPGQTSVTQFTVGGDAAEVPNLGIERVDALNARLFLNGKTGSTYQLKSSQNLQQWSDVGVSRAGADAVLEWTVPVSASGRRYYRVEISAR